MLVKEALEYAKKVMSNLIEEAEQLSLKAKQYDEKQKSVKDYESKKLEKIAKELEEDTKNSELGLWILNGDEIAKNYTAKIKNKIKKNSKEENLLFVKNNLSDLLNIANDIKEYIIDRPGINDKKRKKNGKFERGERYIIAYKTKKLLDEFKNIFE